MQRSGKALSGKPSPQQFANGRGSTWHPASELEGKIMTMLRGQSACVKLKGIDLVYVGSIGREPNWFARTIPSQVTEACRRAFVTAFAKVRKEFDLSTSQSDLDSDWTLGDPKECRARAAYCAKQATTAASPLAREKFAHMAQVWLHLAIQLEEQWMLLDQWAVKLPMARSDV